VAHRAVPFELRDSPPRARRRSNRLFLSGRRPLRDGTIGAFVRILRFALSQARRADCEPVEAVHEFRKAIRRARAVIDLLRPALGKPAATGLQRRLRGAFRQTGSLRDASVLLSALRGLPEQAPGPGRAAAEVALLASDSGREAPVASDVLEREARQLRSLDQVLDVLLPEDFSTRDIEKGLARSAQRVRAALAEARRTSQPPDFHRFRKRVKELRYQVELLSPRGRTAAEDRTKRLGDYAQRLGRVTDGFVLESALRSLTREDGDEISQLLEWIERFFRERSVEALEEGASLFSETPRQLARRVLAERG